MKQYTHSDLCLKAVAWLKRSYGAGGCGCSSAFAEVKSGSNGGEIVDAVGLRTADGTETIVVEAKVSRSDFLADKKKSFRINPELGMGDYRYYICPEGMISREELPDQWGLLYVGQRGKVSVVCGHYRDNKEKWKHKSNRDAELGMAILMLGKVKNLGDTDQLMRSVTRLENENQKLRLELNNATMGDRMDSMIRALDDLAEGGIDG